MLTVGALTALPLPGSSGALTATTVPVPPVSLLLQDATADDLLLLHPRSQWDQRPLAYSQHGATATSTATSSTSNTASAAWSLQLSRHATTIEAVHDKQHDTKAAAVQYREVVLQQQQQQQQQDETDPRLSSSLSREPGAYEDFVKGRTTFKPFMPGGMEDDVWRRKAAAVATTTSDGDDTEAQTLEDIKKNLFGTRGKKKKLSFLFVYSIVRGTHRLRAAWVHTRLSWIGPHSSPAVLVVLASNCSSHQ